MTAPVAFSYIRFSSPEQAKGDSLRRQTTAAADWCQRNAVRLDTSTTLHDLGRSAFGGDHRRNPDRHALAAFLKLVEAGKVPRGSYLVIENLDRLSREHIQPALLLVLNLLQAGVRIVQLKPSEMIFDNNSDTMPVMMMMMELSRGHGESAMKSERVGRAWAEKKKRARATGEMLTKRLPAWIEAKGGKLLPVPCRVAAVRRIFELAASGYGRSCIIQRLAQEGVRPFGKGSHWARSYVSKLLNDRRLLGELQPCRGRSHKPDGEAVPDYFPAVISQEEWYAARAGAAERRGKQGRVSETRINVFAGLLHHARDGDSYHVQSDRTKGSDKLRYILRNGQSMDGRAARYGFPLEPFEIEVLKRLREIDPAEVLPSKTPDKTLALTGELAQVEAKIAELEAELIKGDVAALARVLRQQEDRKRKLGEQLAEARRQAASPVSEAWTEYPSLVDVLAQADDPEDARLRLRSALRRMVEGIWLLVVRRGLVQLAALQVWFTGGKRCRDYLILYRQARGGAVGTRPAKCYPCSWPVVAKPGTLDLRRPADARKLEAALAGLDLKAMAE